MNKHYGLIEELLGFYFIWFPIEVFVLYFTKIINKNIINYNINVLFNLELFYHPLKIILNNLLSNNKKLFNKNSWINSIIKCGLLYIFLNTYNFENIIDFCKYLIIIALMEKARYSLFKLLKKIIKKYKLNTINKILNYIIDSGRIFGTILWFFQKKQY